MLYLCRNYTRGCVRVGKLVEKKTVKADKNDGLEMIDMEDIGKKKKRKKTVYDYVRYVIMLVSAAVFVVAAYQLYSIFHEYSKGEKTYDNVANQFTKEEDTPEAVVEAQGVVPNSGFVKKTIDFASLQKENPDVKAWIQFEAIFEGNEISYPVLQHPTDNNFYLKKMWNKEENTAGSIFMDIDNDANFQDYNTFIYGHNMKNLSMFGWLKHYKKQEFYPGKEFFWIYTPEANYQYQIFSIHESKVDSGYFKTFQTMSDEFTNYLVMSKQDSRYDTGVAVSGDDHIITLSTCTASGDNWRLLLQAKLVGVEKKQAAAPEAQPEVPAEGAPAQ